MPFRTSFRETRWLGSGLQLKLDRPQAGSSAWPFGFNYKAVFVTIAACGAMIVASIDRQTVLRRAPPSELLSVPVSPAPDESLAREYWTVMTDVVQPKYYRGNNLPEKPPPEFCLSLEKRFSTASVAAARQLYWRQIRRIWLNPDAWETRYRLDFRWARAAARKLRE